MALKRERHLRLRCQPTCCAQTADADGAAAARAPRGPSSERPLAARLAGRRKSIPFPDTGSVDGWPLESKHLVRRPLRR